MIARDLELLTTTDALALCNACDAGEIHEGCAMGYCAECCPEV